MGFFKAIPPDLEEAAKIGRHSHRHQLLVHAVTEEFVYALTFISSASRFTASGGGADLPRLRRYDGRHQVGANAGDGARHRRSDPARRSPAVNRCPVTTLSP
ncbi:MAG: hypothetical protein DMD99_15355 [Candidatus Rokuibacteriota bacterium]|nr:MAG: hypothetical protein DMD99_15355 [Candidatus Rokubacteria bacterium]